MYSKDELKITITPQRKDNISSSHATVSLKKLSPIIFGIIGGVIFLSFYLFFLSKVPPVFYQARDDGVITLSHARNLAEYGTISINPSGERVEGFSAPLEFWLYYVVYRVNPVSYKTYSRWQGIILMFLLGFVFIQFFHEDFLYGVFFTFLSGFILFSSVRFTEWMGSGMENPLSCFLLLLTFYLMFLMFQKKRIILSFSLIIFLATIVRAESIYIIFPLIIFFVILWYLKFKRIKNALKFALHVLLFWSVYKVGEFLYFGCFFPNTALGEDIFLIQRLKKLLFFNWEYIKTFASYGWILLNEFRIILLIATIPILTFIKKQGERFFLFLGIPLLSALSFFYPFLFGPTRLDIGRTNTHIAVFIVLFFASGLFWLRKQKKFYILLPVFLIFSLYVMEKYRERPIYLCCSTFRFEKFRRDVLKRAKKEQIPRPSFANVDLGAISWHKNFNIVDLGKLGSPILSRLKNPAIIKDYLFEFAAPDFIELHDWWSCAYNFIFTDERFKRMYKPLWETRNPWLSLHCKKFPDSRTGIWIRKDIEKNSHSKERKFLNYLIFDLSLKRIRKEIQECGKEKNILSCEYVTRNVYRFLPELIKRNEYRGAIKLFSRTRTSDYDLAILKGRISRNWYRKALNFLYKYEINTMIKPEHLISKGKFKVYRAKNRLLLLKENCRNKDIEGTFEIKLFPSEASLSLTISFNWKTMGFRVGKNCAALVEIPHSNYRSLRIVQINKNSIVWEAKIKFPPR